MIVIKFPMNKFPKSCDECPYFTDDMVGTEAFCGVGGEYTDEEISSEEDGSLSMYYHGCLAYRPNNCPLEEI